MHREPKFTSCPVTTQNSKSGNNESQGDFPFGPCIQVCIAAPSVSSLEAPKSSGLCSHPLSLLSKPTCSRPSTVLCL